MYLEGDDDEGLQGEAEQGKVEEDRREESTDENDLINLPHLHGGAGDGAAALRRQEETIDLFLEVDGMLVISDDEDDLQNDDDEM